MSPEMTGLGHELPFAVTRNQVCNAAMNRHSARSRSRMMRAVWGKRARTTKRPRQGANVRGPRSRREWLETSTS